MFNIFHCCGKTSKPSVKFIALLDLVLAISIALGILLLATFYPEEFVGKSKTEVEKLKSSQFIVLIIFLVFFFFLEACLFVILQSATRNRDAGQCDNWFKLRLILLCILVFGVVYWLTNSMHVAQIYIIGGVCILLVLYRVYTLMTVKAFYLEIITSKQVHLGHVLQRL